MHMWFLLTGCLLSVVDKNTLTTTSPETMKLGDVEMACALGATMSPMTMTMDPVALRRTSAFSLISAAMCPELDAWEHELARMQATWMAANSDEPGTWGALAQDAAEQELRAHQVAAQRNLWVWERIVLEYGLPGEGECPDLAPEEEFLYLMGLASGSLAVLHDGKTDRTLGVSLKIPRQVERGAVCLDNDAWFGVPEALRAAVWVAVPGAGPEGVDAWAVLDQSATAGDAKGMFLSRSLQAQTAGAAGEDELLRDAIRAHEDAWRAGGDPDFALLNNYAHRIIRHESDRIWMDATGHRTPNGRLGTFPDDTDDLDFDLDAFFGVPDPPDAPPPEEPTP